MKASRVAAVTVAIGGTALVVGIIALTALNQRGTPMSAVLARRAPYQAVVLCFAYLGAVMLWHRPENRISRLFALIGIFLPLTDFVDQYAVYSYETSPNALPLAPVAAWLAGWIWVPTFGSLLLLLLLWFPTGRVPSPGWLPVQYFDLALLVCLSTYVAFTQDPQANAPYDNPLAIPAFADAAEIVFAVIEPLFPLVLLCSVASLAARYRRAGDVERLQLKWFLAAAALVLGYVAADTFSLGAGWVRAVLEPLAFLALPVSAALAILRYRLYDIDVIINRALVYTVLTTVLVAAYAGGVLLFRTLLDPVTGDNDIAIAASTLAVAALFGPAHRRIQAFIDHRFYRSRYDAQRMLAGFAARLRDQVDVDSLSSDVLDVIERAVHPAHASLWVREVPK